MTSTLPQGLTELFGEPISVYTRQQAIEDGELVDVTEWASAEKGFHGGFTCPVVFTRALWAEVDVDGRRAYRGVEDTRGRAHDVLWMTSLSLRRALANGGDQATVSVLVGRKRHSLLAVVDGDGVTVGFLGDF